MGKRVAITGMGIVSAIGLTVEENFAALINGQKGISTIENIDTVHRDAIKVGEIKLTNEELVALLALPTDHSFTRTSLLGALAAKQAVTDAGLTDLSDGRTGFISATSVGGMDATEQYFYDYFDNPAVQKYILSHDAGDSSLKIADYLGLKGYVTTLSTACSSAANAILLGSRMIKSGRLDRVIVGGADALSKFTINGFKTLMILSDTDNIPFDQHRKGLNLGEAAAYLVLEDVDQVDESRILGYVSGYANTNDAYHQTASSEQGDGAYMAMQKALEVAGIDHQSIDYINAHGTATPNNDLSEGRALKRVFGEQVPDFSSTKAYTGHTLAAAAAIEAVYSVLAIQHGVVFPNLNWNTPMKELDLQPQTNLRYKNIDHVLSNSFGFGGNCSTLIFSGCVPETEIASQSGVKLADQEDGNDKSASQLKRKYINGIGAVSAQEEGHLLDQCRPLEHIVNYVNHPSYKELIAPAMIRRMAKGVRMGIYAAQGALDEAGIANPDAILVGTGMGCLEDSEKFLKAILDNKEEFLTPTSFIQSTHNTVAAQIGLRLKCYGPNLSYVNGVSSFEAALLDASMALENGEYRHALVGGVDEIADYTLSLLQLIGRVKKDSFDSPGVRYGEGATFFVLSGEYTPTSYAQVCDIAIQNTIEPEGIVDFVTTFLKRNDLHASDIDVLLFGEDPEASSGAYDRQVADLLTEGAHVKFKKYTATYDVASAFALQIAAQMLKSQYIPSSMIDNDVVPPVIKHILIYNQSFGRDHSLTLLSSC